MVEEDDVFMMAEKLANGNDRSRRPQRRDRSREAGSVEEAEGGQGSLE